MIEGKYYKFLHQDNKTTVIIGITFNLKEYSIADKFWFNKTDSKYTVEFNVPFTGRDIEVQEIRQKDIFIELFK